MNVNMENERDTNFRALNTPVGIKRSGRDRYAAAMYFYMCGEMDSDTLEVYRICAKLDDEDPVGVLEYMGIGAQWIQMMNSARPPLVTGTTEQ